MSLYFGLSGGAIFIVVPSHVRLTLYHSHAGFLQQLKRFHLPYAMMSGLLKHRGLGH